MNRGSLLLSLGLRRERWLACGLGAAIAVAAGVAAPQRAVAEADGAGRAYEMVSPLDKNGNDVYAYSQFGTTVTSSVNGDRAAFFSFGSYDGSAQAYGFQSYVGHRGAADWATSPVFPAVTPIWGAFEGGTGFQGVSEDLGKTVLWTGDPAPVEGAEAGVRNLYVRDNLTGAYRLLTVRGGETGFGANTPWYADASEDFSHVLFETSTPQTDDAPAGVTNLYEWQGGEVRLVSILPDLSPAAGGSVAGTVDQQSYPPGGATGGFYTSETMSEDGRRIFFSDAATGQLYLRENGGTPDAATVHVSASQAPVNGPDPVGPLPAYFRAATPTGSHVLFTSAEKLTDDSIATATPTSADLYLYDVESGELTDLTTQAAGGARVRGVIGMVADASSAYFVADGVLATGAADGQPNVYLWHEGDIEYIATLDANTVGYDAANFISAPISSGTPKTSRISADGDRMVFLSQRQLTTADNGGRTQVYLYDRPSGSIRCVSCPPDGSPATGDATFNRGSDIDPVDTPSLSRVMTADGRHVFFHTRDALVPEDVNGQLDVYEYDVSKGAASLVSDGRGESDSFFGDASLDGGTVLFVTRDRLVGRDVDSNADLYAARAGGGFAAQNPSLPSRECTEGDCQAIGSTPAHRDPASALMHGAGDEAVPRRAFSVRSLSARQRSRLASGRKVAIRVRVAGPGRITVVGRARVGGRPKAVFRMTRRVARAGTVRLRARLSRAARRELRRKRRLAVSLTVRLSGDAAPKRLRLNLSKAR